jgi:hypothetical protein
LAFVRNASQAAAFYFVYVLIVSFVGLFISICIGFVALFFHGIPSNEGYAFGYAVGNTWGYAFGLSYFFTVVLGPVLFGLMVLYARRFKPFLASIIFLVINIVCTYFGVVFLGIFGQLIGLIPVAVLTTRSMKK